MLDWRAFTNDPNNREAVTRMDRFFRSITRVEGISRREMVVEFGRGLEVLDIGAAGHVAQHQLGDWEHGLIKQAAKRAVAVDINKANVDHYNSMGFDFRHADATSDIDLGERFDRIFMGDVIEHVNDPVALLNFAKRHLKPDGRVMVTTPNPFAPRFRQHRRQRGAKYVMANLEHTRWLSMSTMHELVWRAGLEMTALRWPLMKKPKQGLARDWAILSKKLLLSVAPLEDVFVEYAFELAVPKEKRSAA
jgi:2-polyprenyl-3-methyl-5-hydroxy-6-metoxy-1,4-benzoquinol methylase